jgi:hypothetical protein
MDFYKRVENMLNELNEVKAALERAEAALEVASRRLGISGDDLLTMEAQPLEPMLSEAEKYAYYETLKAPYYG